MLQTAGGLIISYIDQDASFSLWCFKGMIFKSSDFSMSCNSPSFSSISRLIRLRGKKGFLLVSHDRDLLDACIDHILVLNRVTIEVQIQKSRLTLSVSPNHSEFPVRIKKKGYLLKNRIKTALPRRAHTRDARASFFQRQLLSAHR